MYIRKQVRSVLLFTILAGFASGCAFLNGNYAAVAPNRLYRSGQVHEHAFRDHLEENGVRTVISLREASPDASWYRDEMAITKELGVHYYSLEWSKDRLLTPGELDEYLSLLDSSSGPILVHCQGGVHRASIASALYRLKQGENLKAAREELIPGFGNPAIGKTLDLYEESDKPFARWAAEEYPRLYEDYRKSHASE